MLIKFDLSSGEKSPFFKVTTGKEPDPTKTSLRVKDDGTGITVIDASSPPLVIIGDGGSDRPQETEEK